MSRPTPAYARSGSATLDPAMRSAKGMFDRIGHRVASDGAEMVCLWKLQSGGTRVDVRQYDRSLAGADHVRKCLRAEQVQLWEHGDAVSIGHPPDSGYRCEWRQTLRPGHMKKRAGGDSGEA